MAGAVDDSTINIVEVIIIILLLHEKQKLVHSMGSILGRLTLQASMLPLDHCDLPQLCPNCQQLCLFCFFSDWSDHWLDDDTFCIVHYTGCSGMFRDLQRAFLRFMAVMRAQSDLPVGAWWNNNVYSLCQNCTGVVEGLQLWLSWVYDHIATFYD